MKFNPFQPNKMISPGMFTGRSEEIDAIIQSLHQTRHGNPQHFLIEGERGIGKSSLLFLVSNIANGSIQFQNLEKHNFLVLQIDLGGVTTQHDIVRSIARQLKSEISNLRYLEEKAKVFWTFMQKWEVLGVKYRADATSSVIEDVRDDLVNTMVKTLSDVGELIDGVLIMIDEADAPSEAAGLGEFVKLFTERLTRNGCDRVVLGLSGLPSTILKMRASHESSPRIFEVLRLDPLEPEERRLVVTRCLDQAEQVNKVKTLIDDDAMDFLCELSEGYPHFIQQFAYSAFAEDKDNDINLNDVIQGAYRENGALAQLGSKYFNEMYFGRVSSPDYRKVLNAMAPYEDRWVPRKILVKESGVKETTLNNALNALKAKNVILADDARQGFYRLPTRSFAAWINAVTTVAAKGSVDISSVFEN